MKFNEKIKPQNSNFVFESKNRSAAKVHELDIFTATVHKSKRRLTKLVEYQTFLVVADGIVSDNEIVELFEKLRDAVSFVHEVTDKVFQLRILFRLADVDEIHKMMLWNDARHFEDVFESDKVIFEQRVSTTF